MNVDWNAVGAVGQWAGALTTAAGIWVALWLALRKVRPSFRVTARYLGASDLIQKSIREFAGPEAVVEVLVTNHSPVPVTVRFVGFRLKGNNEDRWARQHVTDNPMGLSLIPPGNGVRVYFRQVEVMHALRDYPDGKDAIVFAEDSTGQQHEGILRMPEGLPDPYRPAV